MTDQINIVLIWAETGGTTPVTVSKYSNGWVAEVPTYQNFNYMVQGLDQNILHLAESDSYDWQDDVTYAVGARVKSGTKFLRCIVSNTNQDPVTDTTHSSWVEGAYFGPTMSDLTNEDGVKFALTPRVGNTYLGRDVTVKNNIPLIGLTTTGTSKNWGVANVNGEVVVADLGTEGADGRDLSLGGAYSKRLFHEGHHPTVAEVTDAVEEVATDGLAYARRDGTWVTVTSTVVSDTPPDPVKGNGQGWYNLVDGQLYVDIDDGDTSQWVVANPPMIPTMNADQIVFDPSGTSLISTNVQDALIEIFNLTQEITYGKY